MAKQRRKVRRVPAKNSMERKVGPAAALNFKLEQRAIDRIARAIAGGRGAADREAIDAHDVAFHLVDWYTDLETLRAIIRRPDRFTDQEVAMFVYAFLQHAPAHLAAAYKTYSSERVPDVFQVNIHKDDRSKLSLCFRAALTTTRRPRTRGAKRAKP